MHRFTRKLHASIRPVRNGVWFSSSSSQPEYLPPHTLDGWFRCRDCPQEDGDPAPVSLPMGYFENALRTGWSLIKSHFQSKAVPKLAWECIKPKVQVSTDIDCDICSRAISSIRYQKRQENGVFKETEFNWAARRTQWENYAKMEQNHVLSEAMKSEPVNLLALDGGGVRGYLTAKVIQRILKEENIATGVGLAERDGSSVPLTTASSAQQIFARRFNYLAGTSTGGLIAAALALDYPVINMGDMYKDKTFFEKNSMSFRGVAQPRDFALTSRL